MFIFERGRWSLEAAVQQENVLHLCRWERSPTTQHPPSYNLFYGGLGGGYLKYCLFVYAFLHALLVFYRLLTATITVLTILHKSQNRYSDACFVFLATNSSRCSSSDLKKDKFCKYSACIRSVHKSSDSLVSIATDHLISEVHPLPNHVSKGFWDSNSMYPKNEHIKF